MFRGFQTTLAVLGVVTGALSIISLVQRLVSVGLRPAFSEFLSYYRNIVDRAVNPIIELLPLEYLPWDIAPWYGDALVLSVAGTSALARGYAMLRAEGDLDDEVGDAIVAHTPWLGPLLTVLLFALSSFTLFGVFFLVTPFLALVQAIGVMRGDADTQFVGRVAILLLGALTGVAAFYALNAYG
jgi:hypothetical protein